MADRCPYLDYRREAGEQTFDTARPYCTAADEFVQPMRADICAGRYGLDHATDCEIYLAHADDREGETGAE
ncbi:hypothetical protein AUR64_18240 [Haloprofundus marisrubri]|uniref:Uncharacterized protein n=1 Tax=Haloprofundus marisrubri TaxID=1514971 RepID=A0A0W1R6U1_9EURY|nr:hypothetical protein [Haloprofundus marisrubri]KTG08608.1 hypothetical protein AUR64_18240 [Haloprofundus marisrubri]